MSRNTDQTKQFNWFCQPFQNNNNNKKTKKKKQLIMFAVVVLFILCRGHFMQMSHESVHWCTYLHHCIPFECQFQQTKTKKVESGNVSQIILVTLCPPMHRSAPLHYYYRSYLYQEQPFAFLVLHCWTAVMYNPKAKRSCLFSTVLN